LEKQRDLSDNRVLVELIKQGIEAQKQKEKAFFQLAERFRGGVTRSRSSSWEISWDALYLVNKCPKSRPGLGSPRRSRPLGRAHAQPRHSPRRLYQLRLWMESKPDVPDGPWYKEFGSFKRCGEGRCPKTFLLLGESARGQKL
jgi:hypothetical protein